MQYDKNLNLNLKLNDIFFKDNKTFDYSFGKINYAVFYVEYKIFEKNYGLINIINFLKEKMKIEKFLSVFLMHIFWENDVLLREFIIITEDKVFLEKVQKVFKENNLKIENQKINEEWKKNGEFSVIHYRDLTNTYSRKIIENLISKII